MSAVPSPRVLVAALVLGATACRAQPEVSIDLSPAIEQGKYPATTAVLVSTRGRLLYEAYFPPGGPEVLNDTRSATKSVTAIVLGAAIADGHIASVDSPAFRYLADLAPFANDGPAKQGITIEDLLTMSSALDCDDGQEASPGNEENMYPKEAWTRWAVDLPVRPFARDSTGRGPFAYCTAGSMLLGRIIQRAAGEPVDRYTERRLLAPLGISGAEWARSPSGEPMTGGGLRLRGRDLLALGELVARRGTVAGRDIVPAAWIDHLLQQRHQVSPDRGYGGLFWRWEHRTPCAIEPAWLMAGNGGNHVVIWPRLETVVVVARTRYNTRNMHEETKQLVEEEVLPAVLRAAGECR